MATGRYGGDYHLDDPYETARRIESQPIEFLISNKGEIIPFEWIKRLSLNPFNNIDQFVDTLIEPTNPMNEMYAILKDGSNCTFNLLQAEFTTQVSNAQYGSYPATDQIKRMLMHQFAETNKDIPNDRDQERATCNIKDEGAVPSNS